MSRIHSTYATSAKKCLCGILSLTLVSTLSCVPLSAFAAEDEAASVENAQGDGSIENPVLIPSENVTEDVSVEDIMSDFYSTYGATDSASGLSAESVLEASSIDSNFKEIYGESQYDTACEEALYAFSESKYAIIANGTNAIDALSGTALAGALDCPILLASSTELPEATEETLETLGVEKVFILGGTAALNDDVFDAAKDVCGDAVRLAGDDIIGTQLAIYEYGRDNDLWSDTVIVAQGIYSYADALSLSPIAYKLHAPIFLASADGTLEDESIVDLFTGSFTKALVGGGTAAVSERTMGVLDALVVTKGGSRSNVERLGGSTLYDTSVAIAEWATENNVLTWDGAAFCTGQYMTDGLAGSAVQGREGSVLLLINEGYMATCDAAAEHKDEITTVKVFGGPLAVSDEIRSTIAATLGFDTVFTYENLDISLSDFTAMEVEAYKSYQGYSADEILEYMDPSNYDSTMSEFMVFANLGTGYSGVSADTLNDYIASRCTYSEASYGVTSNMRGMGQAFVDAAKEYNVNEVYLVAHAAIESAWGCSNLAQGKISGSEGYYNFYGIGAFDSDPNNGAKVGSYYGWNTPETAIKGAAYWISYYYTHNTRSASGPQNTLWKMKWDANYAISMGTVVGAHQYATGRTWATSIAKIMDSIYTVHMGRYFDADELGISYIIPSFKG